MLDNALEAGLIAFGPLMFPARFVPISVDVGRGLARLVPRGLVPVLGGHRARHAATSSPAPMAATIHGIFFGRIAPPSRRRKQIQAPALVVGHPRDPMHPCADAEMLAAELPNGRSWRRAASSSGGPGRSG